jgi:hypothetical protein
MRRQPLFILLFAATSIFAARAQSPAPVVVPALSPAAIISPTSKTAPAVDSVSLPLTIKTLQEMKAANEEILKKQEAALQQLDELQKAADEIKVFSKRG